MTEPIVSRAWIAHEAEEAAKLTVKEKQIQPNPYLPGTDAAAAWKASYERFLLLHSLPEAEASA